MVISSNAEVLLPILLNTKPGPLVQSDFSTINVNEGIW